MASDLRFCSSPNGIRTRVATLRGRSGPPPESAAIRRSPGQGVVVPAGVRSNRWAPRGFSSNASSRPDAPAAARMRVGTGAAGTRKHATSAAEAARVQPPCAGPLRVDERANICESCTFFVTTIEFKPTLQRQRDDAVAKGQRG
jgi:hypothetical protein